MTKEEWAQVEERLKHQFSPVTLICDDYRLTLHLTRIKAMSLGITFYVNGWMRGEWFGEDCEERRRFFRPEVKCVWSVKQRQILKKISKKFLKERGLDLRKTFISYNFYWTSFRALKAHLIKHNNSIQLVPVVPEEIFQVQGEIR